MSEQINGNSYYEVVDLYYKSEMYKEGKSITEDMYGGGDIVPAFNPIPKVINISVDLAVGGELKYIEDSGDSTKDFLEKNNFNEFKVDIMRELIKGKTALLELEKEEEVEEPYTKITLHTADTYEIIKDNEEVLEVTINYDEWVYNADEEKYEQKSVEKKYIKLENGNIEQRINTDDGEEREILDIDVIPVVELVTGYDLRQLLYSTDAHNQIGYFINKVFYLAGEPILFGRNIKNVSKQIQQEVVADRYSKLKMFFSHAEGELEFLEISGSSLDKMLEKQKNIETNIIHDYPEYSMSDVVSGSNVSTDTTRIRLSEILSRVNDLRTTYEDGLNFMAMINAKFNGTENYGRVELPPVLGNDLTGLMEKIQIARELGIISKYSSMALISELFAEEDVEKEIARIKQEESEQTEQTQTEVVDNE